VPAGGRGDQLGLAEREPRLPVQIVAERRGRRVGRRLGRGRGRPLAGPPVVRLQQQRVVRHLGRVVAGGAPLVVVVRVGQVVVRPGGRVHAAATDAVVQRLALGRRRFDDVQHDRGGRGPVGQRRPVVVAAVVVGRGTGQRPEQHAEHRAQHHQARYDGDGDLPAVTLHQVIDQRREDERAQSGTAHGDPGGQRPVLVEVTRHAHDGWQIDHAEAQTCEHTSLHLMS